MQPRAALAALKLTAASYNISTESVSARPEQIDAIKHITKLIIFNLVVAGLQQDGGIFARQVAAAVLYTEAADYAPVGCDDDDAPTPSPPQYGAAHAFNRHAFEREAFVEHDIALVNAAPDLDPVSGAGCGDGPLNRLKLRVGASDNKRFTARRVRATGQRQPDQQRLRLNQSFQVN